MRPLISVTQNTNLIKLSVRLQFQNCQARGNIWGIPPEVPPSDEVTQACARATKNMHGEKQAFLSGGRALQRQLWTRRGRTGRAAAELRKKKKDKSPLRYEKHAAVT